MTSEQQALVVDNIRLAEWIANRWRHPLMEREDVRQIALEAFCKAAKVYRPEKGKFSTLAIRYATLELLKTVKKIRRPPELSLESVIGVGKHEDPIRIADILEDSTDLDDALRASEILEAISMLGGRAAQFMSLIAGGHRQVEVARMYGISKEAVNKTLKRARPKLAAMIGR